MEQRAARLSKYSRKQILKKFDFCVIGVGYIGLPTAVLLASQGKSVSGSDINAAMIDDLNNLRIPFDEPGMDDLFCKAVGDKSLHFTTEISEADTYIICVPTPLEVDATAPKPDVTAVLEAAKRVARVMPKGATIIVESTCPVGTTARVAEEIKMQGWTDGEFFVAYCPERVLPGNIMTEMVANDRVVGGLTSEGTAKAAEKYREFVDGEVLETTAETAELCKLIENSYRDVNIAFANELSIICDDAGIDVWDVIRLANRHPRVNILQPGIGVGGHCIAVDPWFIVDRNPQQTKMIRQARQTNDQKTSWASERAVSLLREFQHSGDEPRVVCLGLAFKPNVNDLRESPAVRFVEMLSQAGYVPRCVEPNIDEHGSLQLTDLASSLEWGNVFFILVAHDEFKPSKVQDCLSASKHIDFCGLL